MQNFLCIFGLLLILCVAYVYTQDPHAFSKVVSIAQAQSIQTITQPPPTGDDVRGSPTVSPQLIDQVLCKYGSPACGTGQNIYDLGVQYGIDPAYPVGFFWEESNFGRAGEARFSHSVGNLRSSPLEAYEADGYAQFSDWQTGERAWYELISNLYIKQWGLTTVPAILERYAPTGDGNSPSHYAEVVESAVALWRAGKVTVP